MQRLNLINRKMSLKVSLSARERISNKYLEGSRQYGKDRNDLDVSPLLSVWCNVMMCWRPVLTLTSRVHASEHLPQLLRLHTARGGELSAPLEDQQEAGVLVGLLLGGAAAGLGLGLGLVLQLDLAVDAGEVTVPGGNKRIL